MLLVIDVGNTNTVIGIYDGHNLKTKWRIRTVNDSTEDEMGILIASLFSGKGIDFSEVDRTIITCVVPPVVHMLNSFCLKYLGHSPHFVHAGSVLNMPLLYKKPSEIGADRIVNAVAAFYKYKTGLVVIDFGTATTFDSISEKGEYLGGAISPGLITASEALFAKASKLPMVDLFVPPGNVIGKDTITSIRSGIIYGYAGLVDGIVSRIKCEMDSDPLVVATGGLCSIIKDFAHSIDAIEPDLTLYGLCIIGNGL